MRKQELHPRTAVVNKKQKNQAKKTRNEALVWLANMFPCVFDNSILIQPLKLGIMSDILAHADAAAEAGISKSKLREAVVLFTRRIDYLTCLKAREMRVDLQGNPVMLVTEDEANRAALKIKKRVEKSAKNARKNLVNKPKNSTNKSLSESNDDQSEHDVSSSYADSSASFNGQNTLTQVARVSSVLVKHKSARTYDPDAVARLKEKLGLSRNLAMSKEVSE